METISTYVIAGGLIAIAVFLLGVVLMWFAGLAMAVWWSVKRVHELFKGRNEDIG